MANVRLLKALERGFEDDDELAEVDVNQILEENVAHQEKVKVTQSLLQTLQKQEEACRWSQARWVGQILHKLMQEEHWLDVIAPALQSVLYDIYGAVISSKVGECQAPERRSLKLSPDVCENVERLLLIAALYELGTDLTATVDLPTDMSNFFKACAATTFSREEVERQADTPALSALDEVQRSAALCMFNMLDSRSNLASKAIGFLQERLPLVRDTMLKAPETSIQMSISASMTLLCCSDGTEHKTFKQKWLQVLPTDGMRNSFTKIQVNDSSSIRAFVSQLHTEGWCNPPLIMCTGTVVFATKPRSAKFDWNMRSLVIMPEGAELVRLDYARMEVQQVDVLRRALRLTLLDPMFKSRSCTIIYRDHKDFMSIMDKLRRLDKLPTPHSVAREREARKVSIAFMSGDEPRAIQDHGLASQTPDARIRRAAASGAPHDDAQRKETSAIGVQGALEGSPITPERNVNMQEAPTNAELRRERKTPFRIAKLRSPLYRESSGSSFGSSSHDEQKRTRPKQSSLSGAKDRTQSKKKKSASVTRQRVPPKRTLQSPGPDSATRKSFAKQPASSPSPTGKDGRENARLLKAKAVSPLNGELTSPAKAVQYPVPASPQLTSNPSPILDVGPEAEVPGAESVCLTPIAKIPRSARLQRPAHRSAATPPPAQDTPIPEAEPTTLATHRAQPKKLAAKPVAYPRSGLQRQAKTSHFDTAPMPRHIDLRDVPAPESDIDGSTSASDDDLQISGPRKARRRTELMEDNSMDDLLDQLVQIHVKKIRCIESEMKRVITKGRSRPSYATAKKAADARARAKTIVEDLCVRVDALSQRGQALQRTAEENSRKLSKGLKSLRERFASTKRENQSQAQHVSLTLNRIAEDFAARCRSDLLELKAQLQAPSRSMKLLRELQQLFPKAQKYASKKGGHLAPPRNKRSSKRRTLGARATLAHSVSPSR